MSDTTPALPSTTPAAQPELPAWLSAIKPVGELSREPKSILIYGRQGTGKSTLAKTIADVKNPDGSYKFPRVLFIDTDDGTEVIEDHYKDRIFILPVNTPNNVERVTEDLKRTDLGFDAIVFDTVDVAQDYIEANPDKDFGGNNWDKWDSITGWTNKLFRIMQSNPSYVGVLIAHSEEKKEKTGGVREAPKLSGKSSREVGGTPSMVIYMTYDSEGSRVAILGGNSKLDAKNRHQLPDQLPDPTFPKLYKGIAKMIEAGMVAPEASE